MKNTMCLKSMLFQKCCVNMWSLSSRILFNPFNFNTTTIILVFYTYLIQYSSIKNGRLPNLDEPFHRHRSKNCDQGCILCSPLPALNIPTGLEAHAAGHPSQHHT